jgi:Ca2+-transporting ATPase
MTFAILALSTIWLAASMRRSLQPIWAGPLFPFWAWMAIPIALSFLAVELPFLQEILLTTDLSDEQWLTCLGLSLAVPIVIEVVKAVQRRRRLAAAAPAASARAARVGSS